MQPTPTDRSPRRLAQAALGLMVLDLGLATGLSVLFPPPPPPPPPDQELARGHTSRALYELDLAVPFDVAPGASEAIEEQVVAFYRPTAEMTTGTAKVHVGSAVPQGSDLRAIVSRGEGDVFVRGLTPQTTAFEVMFPFHVHETMDAGLMLAVEGTAVGAGSAGMDAEYVEHGWLQYFGKRCGLDLVAYVIEEGGQRTLHYEVRGAQPGVPVTLLIGPHTTRVQLPDSRCDRRVAETSTVQLVADAVGTASGTLALDPVQTADAFVQAIAWNPGQRNLWQASYGLALRTD